MVQTSLSSEEIEYIVDEARYGELDSLKQIFDEIDPKLLLSIRDAATQSTLLHMAAANGHLAVVQLLSSILVSLKSSTGKDEVKNFVNSQNGSGNTALHWAALNGHLEVVKVLCEEHEADPFVRNGAGHDAIFEAENNNKEDVEDYFLKRFSFNPGEGEDGDAEEGKGNESTEKEGASGSQPTFTPGTEIDEVTKEAIAAKEQLSKQRVNNDDLMEKTKDLKI